MFAQIASCILDLQLSLEAQANAKQIQSSEAGRLRQFQPMRGTSGACSTALLVPSIRGQSQCTMTSVNTQQGLNIEQQKAKGIIGSCERHPDSCRPPHEPSHTITTSCPSPKSLFISYRLFCLSRVLSLSFLRELYFNHIIPAPTNSLSISVPPSSPVLRLSKTHLPSLSLA